MYWSETLFKWIIENLKFLIKRLSLDDSSELGIKVAGRITEKCWKRSRGDGNDISNAEILCKGCVVVGLFILHDCKVVFESRSTEQFGLCKRLVLWLSAKIISVVEKSLTEVDRRVPSSSLEASGIAKCKLFKSSFLNLCKLFFFVFRESKTDKQ